MTTVGLTTPKKWTAEDFERYGAKLAADAEKKKATEKPKEENGQQAEKETAKLKTQNSIDSARATLAARKKALLDAEGERIRSQYSKKLTDDEVIKVLDVEREMKPCKECNGHHCRKIYSVNFYKVAEYNSKAGCLQIKSCYCPRLTQSKYKLSKIPTAYINKTWEDYKVDNDNTLAVKAAKKLLEMSEQGAYFFGSVGTGKTLLAAIMAQELIRRGREVTFATVPTISARIRSTFNQKETKLSETDILEKLYTVPTLILDDIGMEKPTRFVCSTLCNIFNERYNAQLQTIMTSNYKLEELESIFNNPIDSREKTLDGTRILDRCKQMCFPVELKGKSRRG